jgi:hypothetical protein
MGKQRQQQLERGWRTSHRSGTNGNCAELASGDRTVFVRDTKDRDGVTLSFTSESWAQFLASRR